MLFRSIAYSIADRPGLAPGMIGGILAGVTGSGFLGGIIAGFVAGYFTQWLNGVIKLPRNQSGTASWREKVEISVSPVPLKKKITQMQIATNNS